MHTVPRGAGGAIPRPFLHPAGRRPGNPGPRRCPERPRRWPQSIAGRARPPPPSAPGRMVVETKPRCVGVTPAIEKEEVK